MDVNLLLFDVPSESPAHKSETQINNPFDQCEWNANHNTDDSEDPFEIVTHNFNKFDRSITNNYLINMNGSCESNNNNLSNNLLNLSTDHSGNNSNLLTPRSVKMAHKLVKSGATPSPISLKRDRVSSDSGILKMTQGKMLLEKLRESTSLDSNTLVTVTKKTNEILCPSFTQGDTSCDDLNSTTPKWVDLEQDEVSDIDTLTIPFLLSSSRGESDTQNGVEDIGENHTKLEMNKILENIKKSNEKEEKQLFLNNLEISVEDFMTRFEITKNCDKIKTVLNNLIELLEGKELLEEKTNKSVKIIRQETFELPKKPVELIKTVQQIPSASKKISRSSLNVSSRESISHRSAVTTPKMKVRASISHPISASKKENRSPPSVNIARRSLYATPSKQVKSIAEIPSGRIRLRTKTQTLSTGGPVKALEPARATSIPPRITYTPSSSSNHNPVISSSTPIQSKRLSTSRITTPAKTPIGKGISKIATPSRLSKLHTPSRIRTTLGDFNAP